MKNIVRTLNYIWHHPLSSRQRFRALTRYVKWQCFDRFKSPFILNWGEGAKLLIKPGMTGATGNLYCGLHEFTDMGFLLHFLRRGDLFVDVGANIGSYSVLASAICRANVIAFEPDPETYNALVDNANLNGASDLIDAKPYALGATRGQGQLTVGLDSRNHLTSENNEQTQTVDIHRLDDVLGNKAPILIKLDVEGAEPQVIAGGQKCLDNSSLVAVITESRDDAVIKSLKSAGFSEVFYDPFSREFRTNSPFWKSNNALYVRHLQRCQDRVKSAPHYIILGQDI